MTRKEIESKIESNKQRIVEIKAENEELWRQSVLLSDDEQWFTEQTETVTIKNGRKKTKVEKLLGRIHWNEEFKDEDTGEKIIIERSQLVRVDGKWDW